MGRVTYLTAFLASLIYIALKAVQQINVVRDYTKLIMPTSVGMAACEFYLVGYMVALGPGLFKIGRAHV